MLFKRLIPILSNARERILFPYSDCLLRVCSLATENNTHPQREMSMPTDECLMRAHNQGKEAESYKDRGFPIGWRCRRGFLKERTLELCLVWRLGSEKKEREEGILSGREPGG